MSKSILKGLDVYEADFFKPIEKRQIDLFETNENVSLPDSLKEFYLKSNGYYDGSLFTINNFAEIKNIIEFDFGYIPSGIESHHFKNQVWRINENNKISCLIDNPENYYCFSNYNFGGGYWFINLNKSDNSNYGKIILIYHHMNEYYNCVDNIEIFFKTLKEDCSESLLCLDEFDN